MKAQQAPGCGLSGDARQASRSVPDQTASMKKNRSNGGTIQASNSNADERQSDIERRGKQIGAQPADASRARHRRRQRFHRRRAQIGLRFADGGHRSALRDAIARP